MTRGEMMAARGYPAPDPSAAEPEPEAPSADPEPRRERLCAECGEPFTARGNAKTCSPECSRARSSRKRREAPSRKPPPAPAEPVKAAEPPAEPEPERAALVETLATDLAKAVQARCRELLGI
ncbi:MAG: hypothetical protein OXG35_04405 [Acidobacteria bacterium]|nr:hypothetical protein [Acidobacteriota bacterium]